jgi:hypothetical protein
MLVQLFSVPASSPLDPVFTRRQPGKYLLPAVLMAISVVVYAAA